MTAWWMGWYSTLPLATFELHSPWWVSGYREDDMTMVAAVRAEAPEEAEEIIRLAYDDPPEEIEWRWEPEPLDRSPFTDRFPQASWMAWDEEMTCACEWCAPEESKR
jgi:hypothetical protein